MYNHQLNAFIAAAELKSFSKAAERMFITTPALIQQINLLERNIGVPLFIRSHAGVILTKSGKSLYEDALNLIKLSDDAKVRAIKAADMSDMTITVGIIYSGVCTILNSVLPIIQQKIPRLVVEFSPLTENVSELSGTFDIMECIKLDNLEKIHCNFKRFFDTTLSIGIPHTHPLAGKEQLSIEDLDHCTILMVANNMSYIKNELEQELKKAQCDTTIISEPMPVPTGLTRCMKNNYLFLNAEHYNASVMNLKMVPFKTEFKIPYGLIYREDSQNPLIHHLVAMAAELFPASN